MEDRRHAARSWFEELAGRIIATFEALEESAPARYAGAPVLKKPYTADQLRQALDGKV